MAQHLNELQAIGRALGITTVALPNRERLGGLLKALRHDMDHNSLDTVPRAQIILIGEACRHAMPMVPDAELTDVYKNLNAFEAFDPESTVRDKIRAKFASICDGNSDYSVRFACRMLESLQRGFDRRDTFTLNDVAICAALEQLAILRLADR